MKSRWREKDLTEITVKAPRSARDDIRKRIYTARLLGAEPDLVLHGGGNVSLKTSVPNVFGVDAPVTFVKASGCDMRTMDESGFVALDQEYLSRLSAIEDLSDEEMKAQLSLHVAQADRVRPSIEALMHVFLPAKYVDHTHPASILALTNRVGGRELVTEVLGERVVLIPYVRPGFQLARAVAQAYQEDPESDGLVLMHHGLVTWGNTACDAYEKTVELVSRAEDYLQETRTPRAIESTVGDAVRLAEERYREIAPILRGMIASERTILQSWIGEEVIALLAGDDARDLALTAPLTPDNLIRIGLKPLLIEQPAWDDLNKLRQQLGTAVESYSEEYSGYVRRHSGSSNASSSYFPKTVLMPGLGAVCLGRDVREATIARDVLEQNVTVKQAIVESGGTYEGLSEERLHEMEYNSFQQAKLLCTTGPLPSGTVALITGCAGAIGSGICQRLLCEGCHVAVTDLAGKQLDSLVADLRESHGDRVLGVPLDVTREESVAEGFGRVVEEWGGVDLLVVNAGLAHVARLGEMELADFQRLERVNVEGTLLVLREATRLFKRQGMGGDVVVVSTKNVFAPGAGFGAYSATKAACHQLARIASLEMAELDVRVNMVSPDAVFSHEGRQSGLWAEVGPGRMKARGLDAAGLEEYYKNRNLLKVKVTAEHVANAVMFFATRQTPTTGATIPVDGGLPDATPR